MIKDYFKLKKQYSKKYQEVQDKVFAGDIDGVIKCQKELIRLDKLLVQSYMENFLKNEQEALKKI